MPKLVATLNVIAWSGFWAFGYLALTGPADSSTLVALILAALGAGAGLLCYLWLARHCETTGYARPARRVLPEHLRNRQDQSGEMTE
ncbi:hypothetical protein LV82_00528 [Albidovulum inexpectatum]|uniref:Uncharacterized protein n=1 Tax=Albidovulum inexpectatum TaxID=196587 RepID=A0A2S5JMB4_9RHOB|nr:hypothetical protein [Albidovulum inexpectatum]PPB82590.1 hypothetical protein LV82_00528 [Albidovulum inexpectatum]